MKKMTKAMLMTALILGSVQWGGTAVHASELDTFTLDEYVVTAARTETKLVDTPANITIVGAEEIESRHYTDVAEVLKDVPGANVLDNGTGTSEKAVLLNGDERVLVLVDGRRVNFDMGTMTGNAGYDFNQLPDVSLIERIEVLKGAGGALYGSDAVGGVINVITKKVDRSLGKVSIAFGSGNAKDMSAMYSIKQGKTAVTMSASKYEKDYYKYRDYASDTTKRWPLPSEYENDKVSLKIDQELNNGSNLTVGYDYSKFEGMSPYSVSNKDYGYDSSAINKQTDNIYIKYDWNLNEKDQGYLQFYHNELDYFNGGGMEEKTNGIDLQQTLVCSETNKIVVGGSWRKVDVKTTPISSGGNDYDESIDNVAVFINDNWEFAPSWNLNAGIRYDEHSEVGGETTMSVGLNKKFNDDSHAYVNWGEVFRAPTTDDLFYSSNNDWSYTDDEGYHKLIYINNGNPDLKPETGETWTIGYGTKLDEKTDINVSYFESDIEDAIDWQTTWKENFTVSDAIASNIDEQKKRGLELNLKHKVNDNLGFTASYTYLKVENNDNGSGYVRDWNYMPNMYRFGVNYHEGKWNSNLYLRMANGGATHTYTSSGRDKRSYLDGSYITIDLAVTYQATKDLKIFAKGYNLLNEAYAEQAGVYLAYNTYDYPAQSRRFLIGAEYSF